MPIPKEGTIRATERWYTNLPEAGLAPKNDAASHPGPVAGAGTRAGPGFRALASATAVYPLFGLGPWAICMRVQPKRHAGPAREARSKRPEAEPDESQTDAWLIRPRFRSPLAVIPDQCGRSMGQGPRAGPWGRSMTSNFELNLNIQVWEET